MTIVRIPQEFVESFSLEVTPTRTYSASGYDALSGTYSSATGSVFLYSRRSDVEKEPRELSPFVDASYKEGDETDVDGLISEAKRMGESSGSNYVELLGVLSKVNALPQSRRKLQVADVFRFEPPYELDREFLAKRQVREVLLPYYRTTYPSFVWAYHNYHSLNFFTGSLGDDVVPTDTVLMYPNTNAAAGTSGNVYLPPGAFSFDFRINPRYTTPRQQDTWRNGTILHMSGVYALSLLTGSHRDVNGLPDRFRLALQVLSGTFTRPSSIVGNANGIFLSDDDVLRRNCWHHVVVRWGTSARDSGTGSFVVDGAHAGSFVVPSASLATSIGLSPDILYVGNFYEGPNTGSNLQTRFFSTTVADREGLVELQSDPSSGDLDRPMGAQFAHPLNAELHELRMWDRYIGDEAIASGSTTTPDELSGLMLYVPPLFTAASPTRTDDGVGGVLQTPFSAVDGTTDTPFNVAMSFGVGALYINLENFTRDFARDNWPRLYNLSASQLGSTSDVKPAEEFLYVTGSVRKRNLTVLPCDDGQFTPDFSLLATGSIELVPRSSSLSFRYADDLGAYDPSLVRLTDMVPSGAFYPMLVEASGTLFSAVVGPTPDDPTVAPGAAFTVLQRTRDASSNEVVVFDVSNLFYDRRIRPGTLELVDESLTGSGGRVGVTLRDNGYGSLYRADADTEHAVWASVGNVLYDEGLIVVKSPHLPRFGREAYSIEFKGSHHVHTMRVRVPAAAGMHTSSSNPTYVPISASMAANEYDPKFVYITGINLHDENMNVVMKTTVAQPIVKRSGDSLVVKVGVDF